ncbi:hypothetical protein ANCDUO_24937, partial [Ancylostoma duodenale]
MGQQPQLHQQPPSQPQPPLSMASVDQKPVVYNPYVDVQAQVEQRRSIDDVEKKEEEVDVKPARIVPEPLIQPSAHLFDDRDDATPPMRTEEPEQPEPSEEPPAEVEDEKEASPSPTPPTTSASGIAPADYSTLSDETQPALAISDDLKEEEEEDLKEEEVEEPPEENSVDTTSVAVAEEEEPKVEPEEETSDEPTPGPSCSREPSPGESEVTESEPPSVKPPKRSRKKDRFAALTKEENFEDRDATPSEVAESTDGVFTEPSTPAPPSVASEGRKPKRLTVVRSRKKKSVDDSGDDDDDFVPDGRRKSNKRASKAAKEAAAAAADDDEKRSTSKWADVVEAADDDAEDSILTTDSQETQSTDHQIVEK